ncbi:clpA ATP-binding subunits of Clp protease and DnaK/DnaJ chaperones [uncultured Caudovirales phage]|uniref:ClpA ATP-binding subunits of Clp protease and DnaK/DnaJ chaperones n=1 Tax=uncultured Caudovirales phage TaxID=2100421 RepID=A0A6J5SW17_9CAUD|nr:clpA ATP-binding subunits of Clp protease and DnaK/DnaJ chaperones [uncultured Caudovirales phage]
MAKQNSKTGKTPMLDSFGKDLTQLALEGKLDPVVGREKEIRRCSQILARRKKNNPLLIGEPGVGKTAIVEGLAKMIIDKTCPRVLFDKKIITLELANLVAGTKYRGQFEERMEQIIEEVQVNPNVILFIDEIHTLIGAGSASGSLDAANILKPALSRGEIQCIGATTLDEFRGSIEKDGALSRRFQQVMVNPSTLEQSRQIIENIRSKYEDHHSVKYTDEALDACVAYSDRYLQDRFLPDKAIDLMDEAGAAVHINGVVVPEAIKKLEEKFVEVSAKKQKAVDAQQYEAAAKLRDDALKVMKDIDDEKVQWEESLKINRLTVSEEDIANVVAIMTGIPVTRLKGSELERLSTMAKWLKERVIGQSDAVSKLTKAIQRSRAGLKSKNRPIGTFMFLGPTGVGKTELAKQLAKFLFDTDDSLIRIDMTEFGEKFTSSKLIGAPPGYVGYEEGGQLTEKVKRKPYSVILLDEVEKAHPDIFHTLLQVLDEGHMTDGLGRKIDFKNTVIIMTSNLGVKELQDFGGGIGFSSSTPFEQQKELASGILRKAVSKQFAPEFINRLDDIIIFESLKKEDVAQIIEVELIDLYSRVKENGYTVELTKSAKEFLIEAGYDHKFGARPLKRAIQTHVEDLIAEAYIDGKIKDGDHLVINHKAKDTKLTIK